MGGKNVKIVSAKCLKPEYAVGSFVLHVARVNKRAKVTNRISQYLKRNFFKTLKNLKPNFTKFVTKIPCYKCEKTSRKVVDFVSKIL